MRATLLAICCATGFLTTPVDSLAQYDDGARYAFAASANKSTIYVLDLQRQRLAGDISLDDIPHSVSASQALKALVVAHRDSNRLTLIDLSSVALPQIEYPLDISPDYIDVSPLGETVAVYDREQNVLEIHAVKRGAVLLRANDIETDQAFTFSFDGSAIYWVDRGSGTLNVVDLWSSSQQFQLSQPGNRLSALTRSTDGLLGFVSNADTDEVYVIDLRDFGLLTTLRAGRGPGRSWGTADGRYMFVPNNEDETVSAITTSNLQIQYTVKVGSKPVAIHPGWLDTAAAIIGADGSIAVIDIASGEISQRFKFGKPLLEGIVTSDSKTLALPLPARGQFVFVDMRYQEKLDTVGGMPTDIGIASIAVSNNLCH